MIKEIRRKNEKLKKKVLCNTTIITSSKMEPDLNYILWLDKLNVLPM